VEKASDLIHARGYNLYDDLLHGVSQYPPIIQSAKARRHENAEVVFLENMVITIQPNVISVDEKMGLQFGETLLVGKNGCRSLNTYPRKWITCGV
jgi:Xaa-Pro aminopeptidase